MRTQRILLMILLAAAVSAGAFNVGLLDRWLAALEVMFLAGFLSRECYDWWQTGPRDELTVLREEDATPQ